MKTFKSYSMFLMLITLCITFVSCSENDDSNGIAGNSTKEINVYPIGLGLQRTSDIKIFLSELPFESYHTFNPIRSVEVPEEFSVDGYVTVEAEIGKTVYVVALRKYLFSEGYYNITSTASAPLTDHNVTVEDVDAIYELPLVLTEPSTTDYLDKARLTLTVENNSGVVPDMEVYWFGTSELWSDEMKRNIEERYMVDGSVGYTSMTQTNSKGVLGIDIPVNEVGIEDNGEELINYNQHVFFVIDNGVVHPVIVEITSLEFEQTLRY